MATVEKRGKGYRITVSNGYDVNGKQIREKTTWVPPEGMTARQIQKELNRQATLFEEQVRRNGVRGGNVKLADFGEEWFTIYAEKQLKPKTVATYRNFWKRVREGLGHIQLEKLTPRHITAFFAELGVPGIRLDSRMKAKEDFKAFAKGEGMTQREIAQRAGLSITTLEKVYSRQSVARQTADKVAGVLGAQAELLFDAEPEKPLSGKTQLHYFRFLSSMLETAVHWQMIVANPCDRVKPPKSDTKETDYLDEEQARKLVEALDQEPTAYRAAILLMLNTGLRRGELCGLQWSTIDWANSTMSVRKTAVYLSGLGVHLDTPKTKSSRRTIKIPQSCVQMLKQYRGIQAAHRLSIGDLWHDNNMVFPAWDGQIMHPDALTKWFKGFRERHDLPHITLHGLRHTNASLLIAGGVDLRTVANRLGHSRAATTANIYAHAIQSADAAAAEVIESVFTPKAEKTKRYG